MKETINVLGLTLGAGGAEKVISLLLTKLNKDFNVNLILFNNIQHFDIPENVSVFILNENTKESYFHKAFSFINTIKAYKKVLKLTKPNYSISFLTRPNFLNTLIQYPGSRTIISERCFPSIAYRSNKFRYILYKVLIPMLYNRANGVFSNSIHINEDLKSNFRVNKPMTVIYNPVLIPDREELIQNELKQNDIIWLGKLNAGKNPGLLLKALKYLKKEYTVQVLGDGELMKGLKSEAKELNVRFQGKVKDVNKYISQSKCLVLTSRSEGFPNVILEGMAYGLPIVSTNCMSGPLEMLNDNKSVKIEKGRFEIVKYGILINVDDEIGLANALDKLFTDQELYNKLSNSSLERVQDFSLVNVYSNLKKFIQN